ncbi:saccharopine dehydrogenase [Salinisphaera sp. T31B1]
MLYGANGYTGEMIAREAVSRGMHPVLAGRSRHKIAPLAEELGLETRVFTLDETTSAAAHLENIELVLLTAGPFSKTSAQMVQACIAAGAHYLDITGEIDIFEQVAASDRAAREAGVVLCPGVGFDVVPTDCVAAALKEALPDATELDLGFDTDMKMSPGTLKTTIEGAAVGGRIRRDGVIRTVGHGYATRRIDYGRGEKLAASFPWGDVATAYHSTGIGDITVYVPTSRAELIGMRIINPLRPILRQRWLQSLLGRAISRFVKGPDELARSKTPVYIWGEARNPSGERRVARVKTTNSYSLTIPAALAVTRFLLDNSPAPGFTTPSRLMGHDLIARVEGGGTIEMSGS